MSLRVLHVQGPEQQGGAAQAARAVRELLPEVEHHGICALPSHWQQAVREIGGFVDPWAVRFLRDQMTYRNYDLIHLHRFGPWGTAAIVAAKREGIPVVYSCLDYWAICPRSNCYNPAGECDHRCVRCYAPACGRWPRIANVALLGRRCRVLKHLNQVDRVIALSEHSRAFLCEHGMTAPISVIPVPVTVPDLGHVERVPGRVIYAGWVAKNKGAHVFLEAVRLLHEQGVKLDARMIGPRTRPDYPLVRSVQVAWLQTTSREETLREIAAASVLVCCEMWPNPGPLIVAEAVLFGTPVVASGVGGIPELFFETNADGTLCPSDRPDLFAHCIHMILRRRFTGAASKPTGDYFSPARLRPLFEEVYHAATATL